jgi:S1-C subfamily serine protease
MSIRAALFAPLLALLAAGSARAEDNKQIYLGGMRSAVQVVVPDGHGSGSVIDLKQGLVLTNHHVVNGTSEVRIVFPLCERNQPIAEKERYESRLNQLALKAKVVASESRVDLAVVKILEPARIPAGTRAVRLAAGSATPGDRLVSIGNPGASDARWVFTPGEVRQVYRKTWKSASSDGSNITDHEAKIIEATSPTSPGDSGGPCFNDKIELTGVTQGGKRAIVAQGYSYFIDVSEVKKFLKAHKIAVAEAESSEVVGGPPETKAPEPKTGGDEPKKGPGTTPAKDPVVKKGPPKKDGEKEALEKRAENELRLIRTVAKDPNRRDFAVGQLQKFVQKYPGTDAAREASRLLGQLQ